MSGSTLRQRQKTLALLVWYPLLTVAWGVLLWQLDASDLTFDEAATVFVANRHPLAIISYLRTAVREHPPVYYMAISLWIRLVGTSEFGVRMFSVGAGLVGLALVGWLGRLAEPHRPRLSGLLAALLYAVVPGVVYVAREARMYSLGTVLGLLSAGLFVRDWLRRDDLPRRSAILALATTHVLALFTHYYLLLLLVVQPVALIVLRRWRQLAGWLAVHAIPAALGLAWLSLSSGLRMTTAGLLSNISWNLPGCTQISNLVGKTVFSPIVQVQLSLLVGLAVLVSVGLLLLISRFKSVGAWLSFSLLLPPILAYQLPQRPEPRYLAFSLPLVCLAIACASTGLLTFVRLRWLSLSTAAAVTSLALGMLAAGGFKEALTFVRSRYGHTLMTVEAHARPGDGLLFYGPWQWTTREYYDPGGLPPGATLPAYAPPLLEPSEAEPVLQDLLSRYTRLWVLPAAVDDVDPKHFVEGWLNTHAHRVWVENEFLLYVPPVSGSPNARPVNRTFGNAIRLAQVSVQDGPVSAGDPLRFSLQWQVLSGLEHDVRLTLTLLDDAGNTWARTRPVPREWADAPSTWNPGSVISDSEGVVIPQGAPPGSYTVRLNVNDASTGDPLLADGEKDIDILDIRVSEPTHAPVLYGLEGATEPSQLCNADGKTCVTLAAVEPGGTQFQQGYPVPFTVHLLVPLPVPSETILRFVVTGMDGEAGSTGPDSTTYILAPEGEHAVPTSAARPDTSTLPHGVVLPVVLTNHVTPPSVRLLTIPAAVGLSPDADTGRAGMVLEVTGPDGARWTGDDGSTAIDLFDFVVDVRPTRRSLPRGLSATDIAFADEVSLAGYRIDGRAEPGSDLRLRYAWRADAEPSAIYAVFNHLRTPDGTNVAQVDGWPQGGRLLTTQWQVGEYVEDEYRLSIPREAPAGPYTLYVGLYDAATGDRLPAVRHGQRLPGDEVALPLTPEGEP
jgi:hypothetical protein